MSVPGTLAHSRFYRLAAWASAVVIIALGVYLSHIKFLDSEWLSRSGCLIVMLGIWSGIGGIFQERILVNTTRWRRRNALLRAKAQIIEKEIDSEQAEKALSDINEAFDNQIEKNTQSLRLSIGVLELSLLLTGTFLWGFGDLLMS